MSDMVIIGASHAGIQLADSLSAAGWRGHITVVSDDPAFPYQRPPLSKEYLNSSLNETPLPLRVESFYAQRGIDWQSGQSIVEIDRTNRIIRRSDDYTLPYTHLVLATGARNRLLGIAGDGLQGVHYLRSLGDATSLKAALDFGAKVVIVGAGFIGLEFAAVACQKGLEVTVLGYAERPMARASSPVISSYITKAHEQAGVNFRFGEGIASLHGKHGSVVSVVSTAGKEYPADLVLVGIGVVPNTEVAAASGLVVNDGIVVDEYLQTNDANIWAIGDCCRFPDPMSGDLVRLESVQNATDQAKCVATNLVASEVMTPYRETPWFWSHQGKVKLQIIGKVPDDAEPVVRGDIDTGKFSVFSFKGNALMGVESVNAPAHHMAARRIMSRKMPLTPTQATDPDFDLKTYSYES